jgi:hypothetical protein
MSNFTTSIVSFLEASGEDISLLHPYATITITPNPGYVINAVDFSPITPLPSGISSVIFTQSGSNVLANITFQPGTIMPAYNLSLPLCIYNGSTVETYTIEGKVIANTTNTSLPIPSSETVYSASGEYGTTGSVLTFPINAIAGYYFPTQPTISLTSGILSDYTITSNNTYDTNSLLIGTEFYISYTFPNYNISGDIFSVVAQAFTVYSPSVEITSYSIDRASIPTAGGYRTMTIYGNYGANYSVDMNGTSLITGAVMSSLGSYSFDIIFPEVTTYALYTITLSGDLATPFAQANPFIIEQFVDTQITFDANLGGGFAPVTSVTKTYTTFQAPPIGSAASNIDAVWSLIPSPALTGNSEIFIINQPLSTDWSNTNPLLNGGSEFYPGAVITLNSPPTTGTIVTNGFIELYGRDAVTSILDLSALVGIRSIPTLDTVVVSNLTGTTADSGGDNILDNNSPITTKGIEWSSTSDFLTILGSTNDGSGSTDYVSAITGLTAGSTYYVRAYATNAIGTGYGNMVVFQSTTTTSTSTSTTTAAPILDCSIGGSIQQI